MAAYAVILNNLASVIGECYPFRDVVGLERNDIFHPVNSFPDIVFEVIVVRQVTVYAANPAMCAGMAPSGVLF